MLEAGDVQPKCKEHSESAIPTEEHWLYQNFLCFMMFLLQHDDFSLFLIYNMTIFDIVRHCLKMPLRSNICTCELKIVQPNWIVLC